MKRCSLNLTKKACIGLESRTPPLSVRGKGQQLGHVLIEATIWNVCSQCLLWLSDSLTQKQTASTEQGAGLFWKRLISFSFPGEYLQHIMWGGGRSEKRQLWKGAGVNVGRMEGKSLNREGEKEDDTVGTVETKSQMLHLSLLCWRPSATKQQTDPGEHGGKACQTPLYHPHIYTRTVSLSHTLSGSSVWVNSQPFDIPTVRQIWGCQLTWFWLCGIAKDSRGAVRLSTIFV